jgi:uncharacterized membrane protein YqiK
MYWFEYIYNNPQYIINNIKLISEFSIIEYLILILIFIFFIVFTYYILPYVELLIRYRKKESDKIKRKKLIQTIAIQKDLDDEIEKELKLK